MAYESWACAIFHSIPNLQAHTDERMDRQSDRQTERQMDKLIWVGLGNLRFLQVNNNNSRLLVHLLTGFVAAFVISYTEIVFNDVGLRFLS